jgi:hypothetical protein
MDPEASKRKMKLSTLGIFFSVDADTEVQTVTIRTAARTMKRRLGRFMGILLRL